MLLKQALSRCQLCYCWEAFQNILTALNYFCNNEISSECIADAFGWVVSLDLILAHVGEISVHAFPGAHAAARPLQPGTVLTSMGHGPGFDPKQAVKLKPISLFSLHLLFP